ncbi:MAG: RraA family protein [Candidatus Latescibacteria bacterium]|jgi:regulator of RNase E activity RraA|nr:RraA family protein [Candidatus Latescibacterota bacterium]
MNGLSQSDLDLLCQYDTPTICNVIEIFDVRPRNQGYMDRRIKACYSDLPPIAGYATTATWRSDAPAREGGGYGSLDQQVASFDKIPSPPIVVFQDLDDPPVAASFGEVMCSTYKTFGAAGLITSGAARDLEQVRAIDFPVFSNGIICSHGYGHIEAVNIPIRVGGITVYPGDLLHGDCNGITTIPNDIGSDVAHACADYVAAEDIVLNYLKESNPTPEGLAEARNACADEIAKLTERVVKKGADE